MHPPTATREELLENQNIVLVKGTPTHFHNGNRVYPGLAESLHERVVKNPSAPAIEVRGQTITYGQLHYHALQLSRKLLKVGAASEEAIGVITGSGFEQIVAQAAVIYAGCTCCALDPTLPEAQIKYRLSNAGARFGLADKENLGRMPDLTVMPVTIKQPTDQAVAAALHSSPTTKAGGEHRTHLMHTSGSTGKPKTVQITAKALVHLTQDKNAILIGEHDRTAQIALVSFDISLLEIWVTLLRGATILPLPRTLLEDILQLAQTWNDLGVTVNIVPASLLPTVVLAMPKVFAKMNVVYTGGEMPNLRAMRTVLEQGPPKCILNCYGPTECCIFSLVHKVTLEDTERNICPLTQLVGDTKIAILDEHHQRVAEGEIGELFIGGAGVSPGYVNLPEKTVTGRLRKIWYSLLPGFTGQIKDSDNFLSLGGSSLQAAMLIIRIKREFAVDVTAVMVYEATTFADMASYIESGGMKYTIHAAYNRAYRADIDYYVSLGLHPQPGSAVHWHLPYEGRIFLTGATGLIGAFTLQKFLTLPEVSCVVCIVRGSNDKAARARVLSVQEQYGLRETGVDYNKLIVLAGNLENETFGIGEELFQQLAYWASCIFHIAAHVNYAQPYSSHRGANVIGTANILRFQAIGRPKRLHYTSSLSIYGPTGMVDGYTCVGENDHPMKYMRSVQYDNGYTQSKWVAEKMVVDARDDGFPITVYRPGAVFCHSVTGVGPTGDFLARLMGSCIRMRCFPTMMRQSKNSMPVDYMVNAMLHVSKLTESVGQSYNLAPEMTQQPTSEMTEMFMTLQEAAQVPMEELPYNQWLERLKDQDDKDPLRPLLPMLDEKVYDGHCRWEMYESMPIYETDNLRRHLVGAPELAHCPPLSAEMLRKFLIHAKLI
ncbi:hypothetical protein ACN38_g6805 [Penicillium nordicum]|uniref:Carrier domain-containing protein n=1 Tax=Penicillium nordicum TaxID=229535 RepID=A0A0M8NZA7_9EURO|nr:hypothetical protein ACN38_g6805 [Penicillium nordicum]